MTESTHYLTFALDNQEVYELYERDPLKQGLRLWANREQLWDIMLTPYLDSAVFYGAVTILAPWIGIICARTKTVKPALIIGNIFILAGSALMAGAMLTSGRAVIAYGSVDFSVIF